MTNVTSLSKNVTVVGDEVVIEETTRTVMTKEDLENKLMEVKSRKNRIKETNGRLVDEFNSLAVEETEVVDLITQLPVATEPIEKL